MTIQNDNKIDKDYMDLSNIWLHQALQHNYVNNFTWLGRPIIQIPQDMYAMQELIWKVKPYLIIETGIAHGGSLILSASILALLDYCEAVNNLTELQPIFPRRKVLGIDTDIRQHNREAIRKHPLNDLISMIEGSSIDKKIINQVTKIVSLYKNVMVFLDSNHTHEHVLAELKAYAPLVSLNSYCVVWDTGIEYCPDYFNDNKQWSKGNNPMTAVQEYLKTTDNFEIDKEIEYKLMITAAPNGFLKRTR